MTITKPMLAAAVKDIADLKYPVLATPKLDGIRCLVVNGKAVSRKFKPIPNHYIRNWIEANCPEGFDGEIMIPGQDFNTVQSQVMSQEGEPKFRYWVFDWVNNDLNETYLSRSDRLTQWAENDKSSSSNLPTIEILLPTEITTSNELKDFEADKITEGFEGVIVRSPDSPYKCGRSTLKEGYLLKIKRFEDSEAEIIGFEEQLRNDNELTTNELGYAKRSGHKANLVPAGTLGTLLVRDLISGVEFGIGTGLSDLDRIMIWATRDAVLGKVITYKYQPAGVKDKPRFPVFKGFRHEDDRS